MAIRCPKCDYVRKAKETVPETQCPACGVYYAKVAERPVAASALKNTVVYSDPGRSWSIGKTVALVAVLAGVYFLAPLQGLLRAPLGGAMEDLRGPGGKKLSELDFSRSRIVMYSLTTCVYCQALRRKFEANGIPFKEYFLDTDPPRQEEMFSKLQVSGFQGGGVGTPTLEVNGLMMPNNPPFDEIVKVALK